MGSLDQAGDAIDLIATLVNAVRLVEYRVLVEDLLDRRAPTRGIVFTEDFVEIAGQQGRYVRGHGVSALFLGAFRNGGVS